MCSVSKQSIICPAFTFCTLCLSSQVLKFSLRSCQRVASEESPWLDRLWITRSTAWSMSSDFWQPHFRISLRQFGHSFFRSRDSSMHTWQKEWPQTAVLQFKMKSMQIEHCKLSMCPSSWRICFWLSLTSSWGLAEEEISVTRVSFSESLTSLFF